MKIMKTITIAETASGLLVITGELGYTENPKELFARSHSFNSIEKAMVHVRKTIKDWSKYKPSPVPIVRP
jgi:hypothetical protein